ncbi:alpha/beta-Hydrolases superfamily protein [Zea mays]|uniref:Alpha/beta-Hydrolases superfamily protein n=1 Tax=Zea mays TaxID=4577 RepID=A0A1D6IJF3_MAIZE|nr:alpha/beta-Hydrolases superfamily protein [Zea mays]ONM59574.1 alpha/beta-Hydrolases superfamily protein [Zea mays]
MLPRSPERMRRLMQLAYHRPRRFTPGFVLRDLGPVSVQRQSRREEGANQGDNAGQQRQVPAYTSPPGSPCVVGRARPDIPRREGISSGKETWSEC